MATVPGSNPGRRWHGLDVPPHRLDERGAAEDPLVAAVGLPPPAEARHGSQPFALRTSLPLRGRAAPLGAPGTDEGPAGSPDAQGRGPELGENIARRRPGPGNGPQEGAESGHGKQSRARR